MPASPQVPMSSSSGRSSPGARLKHLAHARPAPPHQPCATPPHRCARPAPCPAPGPGALCSRPDAAAGSARPGGRSRAGAPGSAAAARGWAACRAPTAAGRARAPRPAQTPAGAARGPWPPRPPPAAVHARHPVLHQSPPGHATFLRTMASASGCSQRIPRCIMPSSVRHPPPRRTAVRCYYR